MSATAVARPKVLPVIPENIPAELTTRRQWVVWRYVLRDGKWTKPPYQPDGRLADSTDPTTFSTFAAVLAAYRRGGWAGVGYVPLPDEGLVGADGDKCRDPETGELRGEAADAVLSLDTYTEVSPSGTGVRAFAYGRKPGTDCKKGGFEIYDGRTADGKPGGRFLTVTGHRLPDAPATINRRQEQVEAAYYRFWPPGEARPR